MNLLDRLQPEFIKKLELLKDKYPSSYENVKTILKSKDYYSELTIGEGVSILYFLDLEFTIANINDLFNE
jgi:hypothetical protein